MATSTASRRRRRRHTEKASSPSARKRTARKKSPAKKQRRQRSKPATTRRRSTPRDLTGRLVMLPVRRIDPSPGAARLVYADISQLADSIRGDGETEGVGILEPVLVRPKARGRYELLVGTRRWLAAQKIAQERGDPDYRVPARVFDVTDRIARLIAAATEMEQDRRKPIEMALLYQSLREALERESGHTVGIRTIAGIGWHQRSMVRDYLAIGRAITRATMKRAGILDASGRADETIVTKLRVPDLLAIASVPTVAGRVTALRAHADRLRGIKPAGEGRDEPPVPPSPEERLAQIRNGGLRIRVRAPIRTLAPAAASELVRQDLAPAIVAAVDQAQGGVGGDGYYAQVGGEHTILVLPREIEALSGAQLRVLAEQIEALHTRVRRAMRIRESG